MRIFHELQLTAPDGCSDMRQFMNVSNAPIQVSDDGDYLGPSEILMAFENSFIGLAMDRGVLLEVGFSENKQETKQAKKNKKFGSTEQEDVAEKPDNNSDEDVTKEEDSVVAIEPSES